jgi:hypothetical protein
MALDPNIALGVRGIELPNQLAQYGQLAQIQQAQNQNALAQYQLSSAQRSDEQQNKLYAAAQQPGFDLTFQDAIKFGPPGIAAYKAQQEAATARLNQEKLKGEVTAQPVKLSADKAKLLDDKLKLSRQFLDTLDPSDPNAPARYLAWHEANHADPDIGPALLARGVTADQARMQIDAAIAKGPTAFTNLLNQSKLGTEKFIELNKPTTQVVDQSGQRQVLQIPGLGGAPTSVGTYADVPLPVAVEAQKSRIANAGAARQTTNVNTQIPASEEAQKEFMKEARVTFNTLKSAPSVLANMEEAKKLIPSAKGFMGPGGEPMLKAASFLNNRLGTNIATEGITDATVLRSRLFTGVIENLRKLDAQPTQSQQQVLQDAIGNLGTDPNALPRVLDAFGDILREKVGSYNSEVKDAESRGVKFPYNPVIKMPEAKKPAAEQIPGQNATGGNIVSLPDGRTMSFPNAAAAAQFKKAAGL